MNIDPSKVIGNGSYGFVVLVGEYSKKAAKYILKSPQTDDETFRKECEALERFQHPNIVQYFGFKEIGDYNVIEMEYCERKSLSDVLKDPSIIYSMQTVYGWSKHLLDAFLCLQKVGIVHRDIKPSNVLVTRDFILKLGDFGSVRLLDPNSLTTTITLAGTFRYMSPEAYGYPNQRLVTPLTDLYSIGLVLWEIVERRLVYSDFSSSKVLKEYDFFKKLWHGQYSLSKVDCVDEKFSDVVARCTNVHPEKRLNIDECTEVLEWLKKRVEVDLFEPMIDKTQVNVVKPVGFDGTTERIPVKILPKVDSEMKETSFELQNAERETFLFEDKARKKSKKLPFLLWTFIFSGIIAAGVIILTIVTNLGDKSISTNSSLSPNDSLIANSSELFVEKLETLDQLQELLFQLQLALQNEGLWDGEINAGFHNDYAFDINVVPYKNETSRFFRVKPSMEKHLSESTKKLVDKCNRLYIEIVQSLHSQYRAIILKTANAIESIETKSINFLRNDLLFILEEIIAIRNEILKTDELNIWFNIFLCKATTGPLYFVLSEKNEKLLPEADKVFALQTDFKFLEFAIDERHRITVGQLKKYPFLQLTGFSIDMILSMFTERLTTIINERRLSQSDALWSTLLQMWKLSEETPFVHYRYRLGNNLTRVPLFRDSNLQQTIINRYAELHEVYDWFFRIMEGISVDKVVNKKALGILKSHLEHYFGCPNYFLFARVRSDPERLWIQIPTLEGEEGLTMHRDTLAFANVTAKQNDIDPARDDLQIVPQYYLHFVVERISMTLESQEKSLLEVVSEKNNETPMSIKDRF